MAGFTPEELEHKLSNLEHGSIIAKLYSKQRPEQRRLILARETRQLFWSLVSSNTRMEYEGSLQIRDIQEIRVGKSSKEFNNYSEELKRCEPRKCFVLLYGNSFNLKRFSAVALYEQEAENWVTSLRYLVQDTVNSPYPLQVERWLQREFHNIERTNSPSSPKDGVGQIAFKDFKLFLSSVSCKMTTTKLMECIVDADIQSKTDLCFNEFFQLYRKILLPINFVQDIFHSAPNKLDYCSDETVKLHEFQRFLIQDQNEPPADGIYISNFMRQFIQNIKRNVEVPYFTLCEFIDYLFSKHNDIWNRNCDKNYMDMQQPISAYWIASSHNTYLTGDQLTSDSSCEAYARVLRMGCRCIELDCWDGPDNEPYIFHGHTITSKIKFKDVIQTIKDHAFVNSEYPVILSLEQNCSLEPQRKMAQILIEILGDMMVTQRCDSSETQLPSPHQLRRKILLKHKKLKEFEDTNNVTSSLGSRNSSTSLTGSDENENMRNVVKEGTMYIKDPVNKSWHTYHFVLTQQELIYSSNLDNRSSGGDDDDSVFSVKAESTPKRKESLLNNDLHFDENWYHGKLDGGSHEAEQILKTYKHLGDGAFLVRKSETFVGDYSLSVWYRNRPNHYRIKVGHENDCSKYQINSMTFDSLYSLVVYYRNNVLRSGKLSVILKDPVPQPKKHELQEWFHPNTTKEQAEQALINLDIGSFLVRTTVQDTKTFIVSFTISGKVQHCRIIQEGRLYVVDTTQFESLVSLVNHYMRNPLYRSVKLLYPVSQELLRQKLLACQTSLDRSHNSSDDLSSKRDYVICKALYSYKANKPNELSFPEQAIITNVQPNKSMWWQGDYGGLLQRYFPSNYVKIIDYSDVGDSNSYGNEAFTRTESIEIHDANVSLIESKEPGVLMVLQVQTSTMQNPFDIGFDNQNLALEWLKAIQEAAQIAKHLHIERLKKERTARIAKEMSDLIVYFRSVPFREHSWVFYEMSSFAETKAEKQFLQQNMQLFIAYHRNQISRVYPKGQRLDSSNYNPVPFWNVGSQMVALNYQTGDRAMQYNHAKFRDNARCGYLLKPKFMQSDDFAPNNPFAISALEERRIVIRLIAARHLFRGGKCNNPLVVVEIAGASFDSGVKHRTRACDNGFNPVWNEICEFNVRNPHLALLRFELQEEDMFADTHFIAQACYPLNCIRTGYRSITLRNKFSEELELASLLVHISIKPVVGAGGDSVKK